MISRKDFWTGAMLGRKKVFTLNKHTNFQEVQKRNNNVWLCSMYRGLTQSRSPSFPADRQA